MKKGEQIFGQYELVSRLGAGGMAETFAALRRGPEDFEQGVCLKRILPAFEKDPGFRKQFLEEARVSASMRHNNIVQVIDFGVIDQIPYLALELIDGVDLHRLIHSLRAKQETLTSGLVSFVATELLLALEFAQGQPKGAIVHRDISPSNVLLSTAGEIKLADFGIAKALSHAQAVPTSTGNIRGKVPYMAPEYAVSGIFDIRSDLFALGILLYESLAGRRPFQGRTELETMQRIVDGTHTHLGDVVPNAPKLLVDTIEKLIANKPEHRFANASAALDALVDIAPPPTARRILGDLVRKTVAEAHANGQKTASDHPELLQRGNRKQQRSRKATLGPDSIPHSAVDYRPGDHGAAHPTADTDPDPRNEVLVEAEPKSTKPRRRAAPQETAAWQEETSSHEGTMALPQGAFDSMEPIVVAGAAHEATRTLAPDMASLRDDHSRAPNASNPALPALAIPVVEPSPFVPGTSEPKAVDAAPPPAAPAASPSQATLLVPLLAEGTIPVAAKRTNLLLGICAVLVAGGLCFWFFLGKGTKPSAQAESTRPVQMIAQPTIAQPTIAQPTIAQPTIAQPTIAQPTIAQPTSEETTPRVEDGVAAIAPDPAQQAPSAESTTAEPTRPTTGLLVITVLPFGAIQIDNRPVGNSRVRQRVAVGRHIVTVTGAGQTQRRPVNVEAGQTSNVQFDLR